MDDHISEFYHESSDGTPSGNFHKVIALHKSPNIKWKEIHKTCPTLPKGWFELMHLETKDRIEFTRDFWLSKLPYRQGVTEQINRFFLSLEDIFVYVTQEKSTDPFEAQLIYSLKNNSGFYRGAPPGREEDILDLEKKFPEYILPKDYISFLEIHDGFWKTTDTTGLTKTIHMYESYKSFQDLITKEIPLTTTGGDDVNPKSLIPFYESFGMPYYQCFWGEWYPEEEMGNVYYSSGSKSISDVKGGGPSKTMAFPTFIDWLIFYLEPIE